MQDQWPFTSGQLQFAEAFWAVKIGAFGADRIPGNVVGLFGGVGAFVEITQQDRRELVGLYINQFEGNAYADVPVEETG